MSGWIMGFREAVTVCIQDYYTFSGRACRPECWWFFLFVVVGSVLLSAIDAVIFGEDMLLGLSGLFALLTLGLERMVETTETRTPLRCSAATSGRNSPLPENSKV